MKKILTIIAVLTLCACNTPRTTLSGYYGDVVTCGGNLDSSLALGAIGYYWQKSIDKECVENYEKRGYTVIDKED